MPSPGSRPRVAEPPLFLDHARSDGESHRMYRNAPFTTPREARRRSFRTPKTVKEAKPICEDSS